MLRQYRWTWVWVNQGRTLPGERVHVTTLSGWLGVQRWLAKKTARPVGYPHAVPLPLWRENATT